MAGDRTRLYQGDCLEVMGSTPDGPGDLARNAAVKELEEAMPSFGEFVRWARENPPPQEWYDETDKPF